MSLSKNTHVFDDIPAEVLYQIFCWVHDEFPAFPFCRSVGRLLPRVVRDRPVMLKAHRMLDHSLSVRASHASSVNNIIERWTEEHAIGAEPSPFSCHDWGHAFLADFLDSFVQTQINWEYVIQLIIGKDSTPAFWR